MVEVKCIDKQRNKQGVITAYKLADKQNKVTIMSASELKSAIKSGKVKVVNLTLTKDDRLVLSRKDTATGGNSAVKPVNIPVSIKHSDGNEYLSFVLTVDSEGNVNIGKTRNCSLADKNDDLLCIQASKPLEHTAEHNAKAKTGLKRVIMITDVDRDNRDKTKFVLKKNYRGMGIYQQMSASGYYISQNWLISDNHGAELVIYSHNNVCLEELYDIIDTYVGTGKFGVKAVKLHDVLHMHPSGTYI